jgi:hypothetical protein
MNDKTDKFLYAIIWLLGACAAAWFLYLTGQAIDECAGPSIVRTEFVADKYYVPSYYSAGGKIHHPDSWRVLVDDGWMYAGYDLGSSIEIGDSVAVQIASGYFTGIKYYSLK